jgi:hypothetical protein
MNECLARNVQNGRVVRVDQAMVMACLLSMVLLIP